MTFLKVAQNLHHIEIKHLLKSFISNISKYQLTMQSSEMFLFEKNVLPRSFTLDYSSNFLDLPFLSQTLSSLVACSVMYLMKLSFSQPPLQLLGTCQKRFIEAVNSYLLKLKDTKSNQLNHLYDLSEMLFFPKRGVGRRKDNLPQKVQD